MAHNTVWGLDIGNSAIKAVKMERSGTEARILDFDIIDIQGGDEADRAVRVQAALGTLCTNHVFGRDAVYLSLPGDLCLFRDFQLPPGSESKIDDLVKYEAKQQIPFPLEQVEMGYERFEDPAGVGVELIAVRKTIIQETLTLTDQFKLNMQGISVGPIALFNFIYFEYKPQGATMILDAGYKGTDFVVMHGRHIYSRTIPIAGREITRALEQKFKVPYEKAEDLKKNISQSKQADKILGVIEPTLRQLGAEIQRTIGFYKSKSRGQKVSQGYLLGHAFRLPKMAETMASQVREAPFTIVEGVQKIQLDRAVNPSIFANEFPTMAVAIGLGLQGLGLSELSVNLLPGDRKTEIKVKGKQRWGVAALAAVLAALFVDYQRAQQDHDAARELKAKVESTLEQKKRIEDSLKAATAPLLADQRRVERLTRIARDRGRLGQVFRKVAALENAEKQPFFSEAQQTYLTNLYVSRIPFSMDLFNLPTQSDVAWSNNRTNMLRVSKNFAPNTVLYAPLKSREQADFLSLPAELRPDAPLLVVLSGETESRDPRGIIGQIEAALKKMPEVQDVRTDDYQSDLKRPTQAQPNYDWEGHLVAEKPVYNTEPIKLYTAFHVLFRWKALDDPDYEAAQVAAGLGKKESVKKK